MNPLTSQQHSTLQLICQTLHPVLPAGDGDNPAVFAHQCDVTGVADHIVRRLANAPVSEQKRFARFLSTIETPIAGWPLTGRLQRFSALSQSQRESVLRSWASSKLPPLRRFFQTIKRITLYLAYADANIPTLPAAWQAMDYDGQNPITDSGPSTPLSSLAVEDLQELSCDFLIIGSGAGGAVAAGELAAAGHDVLVAEKGESFSASELGCRELEGNKRLFDKTGALSSRDLSTVILAGSTLGGGTTVNWMTALRPPGEVREQWATELGFSPATGEFFTQSIDAVCQRLEVTKHAGAHNGQNKVLQRGCEQLGYRWQVIPRNAPSCTDCSFCGFGCRKEAKRDTRTTFLKDALENGARLLTGATVDRLTIRNSRIAGATLRIKRLDSIKTVVVKCKAAVLAGGSIQSPALLLRSGVDNPNIGKHLYLHPTTAVIGFHEEAITPWSGAPQTILCDHFANLGGGGYGVRLEVAPLHPGFAGMALAWHSAAEHKRLMQNLRYLANTIILCRDQFGGRVTIDASGNPLVNYRLAKPDAQRLMIGVQHALRVQKAAGANRLLGPHQRLVDWTRQEDFNGFLKRVNSAGHRANDLTLFSAHQMSSCRIADNRRRGVFDPEGRSFDVQNLFVADASGMPSSCGVNPMITVMSTAHFLVQGWK